MTQNPPSQAGRRDEGSAAEGEEGWGNTVERRQ